MNTHTPNCLLPSALLRSFRRINKLTGAIVALAVAPAALHAQTTLQWTSTGSTNFGGSGNWNLTEALWWNGASAQTWPGSGTNNLAVFAGSNGTVTLTEGVAANLLRFATNGYVLSGSQTLSLNGSAPGVQVVGAGNNAVLGNNTALVLAGTAGLTKTGSGTLTLNGTASHTFTGGLNVNGGTLALNFSNLSGATPFTNLIAAGNNLSLRGGSVSISGRAGAGNVTAQTFNNTTVNSGLSSILVANGSGATSLTANLGQVSLATGSTLLLTFPSTTNIYTVADGGSITLPNVAGVTNFLRAGIMYSSGSSTRWARAASNGVVTISQSSTAFTATTNGPGDAQLLSNINSTNVSINGDLLSYGVLLNPTFNTVTATISNSVSWTLNGVIGISTFNAAIAASGTGRVIIGSERDFVINLANSGALALSAPVTDNGGGASALTVSSTGSGVTTLSGTNTYTGLTTLNSGALTISTGTINSSTNLVINGGTLRYNNTNTALTTPTTLNGGTLTGVGAVTLGAVNVADNIGAVIANNNSAAGAALTTGNLSFSGAASLNLFLNSTNAVLLAGSLSTGSAGQVVITPVSSSGVWTNGVTYNLVTYTGGSIGGTGFGQFTLGTVAGLNARQSTVLGNTGSAITMTINGDSPYWTGGSNGDWNTTQTGNWKLLVGGTDTTFVNGDQVLFDDNATGTTTVDITTNVTTASVIFSNTTKNYTIGSTGGFGITSAPGLTKNGTGTVTLSSSNTYSGGTTINNGTLRAQGGSAIGDASVVTLADVSTARFDVLASETVGALAGGGASGGEVAVAASQVLTLGGSGSQTFAGSLTGSGGLTVSGSVNQTLTGSVAYGGPTVVNTGAVLGINRSGTVSLSSLSGAGTLAVLGSGSVTLGTSGTFNGSISLSNTPGATFDLGGLNQTIGSLTGGGTNGGTVALGANNLTIRALSNQTFSGFFTGSSNIVINASNPAATVTFGGENTARSTNFTGNVQVQSGTLILGKTTEILGNNSVGLGNQTIFVSNNATARLAYGNAAYNQNQNFVLNGTGADGLGALQALAMNFGNAAIGGIVAETASSVRVTRDASDATNRILLVRNALAGSGDLTLNGGAGSKPGFVQLQVPSSALTLGGTTYGIYSGSLTLTGNVTLIANASNALGNVGTLTVLSGSTSTFNSAASQTVGGLAGAGTVNVNGSTLTVGAGNTSSSFSGVLQNPTNSGSLTKTGSGTFTLAGALANTYSGLTTVNDGVLVVNTARLPGNVTIAGAGTLRFDQTNSGSFNGVISGTGALVKDGAGTLVLGATNTFTGDIAVNVGGLEVATNGAISFAIGGPGTNNDVSGAGSIAVNGQFFIDLTGASTGNGDSWNLAPATVTYGTNFLVNGFSGSGGLWTNTTNGVDYVFSQASGTLTVVAAPTNGYSSWVSYWQGVNPGFTSTGVTADPESDLLVNGTEFAFDGNPMVGSPAFLTANKVGTNAIFRYVARNSGVTYTVQETTNLASGPWTNSAVTVTNSADTNNINIPADYTRKEFTVPAVNRLFYRVEASFAP